MQEDSQSAVTACERERWQAASSSQHSLTREVDSCIDEAVSGAYPRPSLKVEPTYIVFVTTSHMHLQCSKLVASIRFESGALGQ